MQNVLQSLTSSTRYQNFLAFCTANILLILSAKFKVPAPFVDTSLQSLVVVTLPLILGPVMGFGVILAYLMEGALGFPVFQGTPERGIGIPYMIGTTGGHLLGFLLAQVIGFLRQTKGQYSILSLAFIISMGHLIIHLCGVLWLSVLLDWEKAVSIDAQFWTGILVKVVVGTLFVYGFFNSKKA